MSRAAAALAIAASAAGLLATSCKSDGAAGPAAPPAPGADGSMPGEVITRAAVVKSLGACTLEVYRAFLPAAEELATTTQALATDDGATPERLMAARTAWQRAMERWQEVEVFQYGPLDLDSEPGGKNIRDNVYSWPFAGRCAVEQELVSQRYAEPAFASTSLITARGLAAAEYLLFHEGQDNGCAPSVPLNAGPWMTLVSTPGELAKRKRQYSAVVAADVLRRARDLVDAWDPAKGNFLAAVETAGSGSAVYPSAQAALNAQSDALFYVENPTKDFKLGKPLGLKDCASPLCPDELESRFALRAKSHLGKNLEGFEKLFAGCGGPMPLGFDDLLRASNAGDLATRIADRLTAARAALNAVPGDDLRQTLTADPAPVRAVYDAIKAMVDLLRTEFISVLNLQLPKDIQTDND